MVSVENSLVSVQWLHQNLEASNIIILDASLKKATEDSSEQGKIQILNARFFDIKNKFSDTSAPFPNTLPSEAQFNIEVQHLGINKDSAVVVYDDKGIYSSARAWYLFKTFGFNNIAVLDGGLPEWQKAGYEVENKTGLKFAPGNFKGDYNQDYFKFFNDIEQISNTTNCLILDARSGNRFKGLVPEPRKGLRSGNISNSINLPFGDLLNENCLKPKDELKAIFRELNVSDKKLIFSCGSGITACILALAAEVSGYTQTSVYDGSWTEYGSLTT